MRVKTGEGDKKKESGKSGGQSICWAPRLGRLPHYVGCMHNSDQPSPPLSIFFSSLFPPARLSSSHVNEPRRSILRRGGTGGGRGVGCLRWGRNTGAPEVEEQSWKKKIKKKDREINK